MNSVRVVNADDTSIASLRPTTTPPIFIAPRAVNFASDVADLENSRVKRPLQCVLSLRGHRATTPEGLDRIHDGERRGQDPMNLLAAKSFPIWPVWKYPEAGGHALMAKTCRRYFSLLGTPEPADHCHGPCLMEPAPSVWRVCDYQRQARLI